MPMASAASDNDRNVWKIQKHYLNSAPPHLYPFLGVSARRRVGASFRKLYAAERRRGIKQIIIRSNLSNMLYIIIIYLNI